MHKIKISIGGINEGKVTLDDHELNMVAGVSLSAQAGEIPMVDISMYVDDVICISDADITINAIPIKEDIGFAVMRSLLDYFMNHIEWREKTLMIINNIDR
jgi:hypothetical protein